MASDPGPTSNPATGTADQGLPPAVRQRLQKCYETGVKLWKTDKNHDYAHAMFAQCVAQDPANLVYVEAMLDNLQAMFGGSPKNVGRSLSFGGNRPFKKAVAQKEWREVLKLGIELLLANPWDIATLRAMADACAALRFNEVELRYLKNALDSNARDPDVNRHCARSLARMGQYDQAIACWHRVEELVRGDDEAPRMISELSLQKTRHAAGITDDVPVRPRSGPAKETAKGNATTPTAPPATERATEGATPSTPAEPRAEIRLNPRQKLERMIRDNPSDLEPYLQLAELLTREERFGDAEQTLTRALAVSGGQMHVQEQLEEAQMRRARARCRVAEQRAQTSNTDEARDLVRQLRDASHRLEFEIYQQRAQRYPQDWGIQFELALRLKRLANYEAAIPCFQAAVADENRWAAAHLEIGECHQQLRRYAPALAAYTAAASDRAGKSEREQEAQKLALYRAGILATALKNTPQAVSYFDQLVQLDPLFRDTQTRLDKLRSMGDN